MPTLYDIVTAGNVAAFYNTMPQRNNFVTQELFGVDKQIGLNLSWIKSSNNQPIALKASAFDAQAVPRPAILGQMFKDQMPFFKESMLVDEELRQKMAMVLMTGQAGLISGVASNIYKALASLPIAAAARREAMRCMLLTTGTIVINSNGQEFAFDYGMPATNKVTVTKSWSDTTADIISDILAGQNIISDLTGVKPTRAMCNSSVWKNILANQSIRNSVLIYGNGIVTDDVLRSYLSGVLGMQVVLNDFSYIGDTGISTKYVPDNTFCMFPSGQLGTMWFGTTPEEMDLLTNPKAGANVSIVDTGVSITTSTSVDPVQVTTKASQICLPSFELCDSVYILNTVAVPAG